MSVCLLSVTWPCSHGLAAKDCYGTRSSLTLKTQTIFYPNKKQNRCQLVLTVTKLDFSEPLIKSFIQEIKEQIFSLQKKYPKIRVTQHCPCTREKTRRYAQRTLEIQVILFFHHLNLFTITDTCSLILFQRQKQQQPWLCNSSTTASERSGISDVFLETLLPGWNTAGIRSELRSCLLGQWAVWDAILPSQFIFSHARTSNLAFPSKIR